MDVSEERAIVLEGSACDCHIRQASLLVFLSVSPKPSDIVRTFPYNYLDMLHFPESM
jgi:hypothetical protein